MKNIYAHKPKRIESAQDLLTFVKGIPARFFCWGARTIGEGKCCILGHLGKAYHDDADADRVPTDGFSQLELVDINDGVQIPPSDPERLLRCCGKSIKARLIKFLTENLNRKS